MHPPGPPGPPSMIDEHEPGVYVRSNKPDQDLDFLWDRERKRTVEHDRFHLGFFLGGAAVGALITLGICFLLYASGALMPSTAQNAPEIEEKVLSPKDLPTNPKAKAPEKKGFALPFFGRPTEDAHTTAETTASEEARTYEVQAGDTLGRIAIKFYQSNSPETLEKLKQANSLTNTDALDVGQHLTIPPL